jgi:hypothetical protein
MRTSYKSPFRKFVKKQARPFQLAIEDDVEKVVSSPDLGELKKGDPAGQRVHKFLYRGQGFLVAYQLQSEDIVFYMIGPHENFYRDLKRYLREVD